ncbi:MAG: hypothetical protein KJO08_11320, partial [Gammaproteobacteria bacterium]|nr:hypothetical protein [Gammaproteobacteria bacterium]NNJ85485.1 hypothetical protein [Gammaproteobacteria bacterium]
MPDNTPHPPFDFTKFRKEVEARLKKIGNPRLSAAFAARVALAALPMLDNKAEEKGFLWYWKDADREKYLLATCRALQIVWPLSTDFSIISSESDAAAYADAAAAYAAADAYAYAAAYAARADNSLIDWIRQELEQLSKKTDSRSYFIESSPPPRIPLQGSFLAHLREIPSFGYWADWFQARFDGRPLDREVMEKSLRLPEEIANQDPRAINRYLAELADGDKQEKIKRVRAIFIGNGDAGKTSLIQALNSEEVTEGGTDMTPGIAISEWDVPGADLKAHFWDFGDQVIAHATHQFFLRARCVYVLVLNARSTDSNPNNQAEYWLEFIRAFGANAPVLLVGNKCDL